MVQKVGSPGLDKLVWSIVNECAAQMGGVRDVPGLEQNLKKKILGWYYDCRNNTPHTVRAPERLSPR